MLSAYSPPLSFPFHSCCLLTPPIHSHFICFHSIQVVDPALHTEIEALEKQPVAVAGEAGVEEMKASELFKSICAVADIALHCTAREPRKRPAMGDVVAMLLPHVQQWRPQVRQQMI